MSNESSASLHPRASTRLWRTATKIEARDRFVMLDAAGVGTRRDANTEHPSLPPGQKIWPALSALGLNTRARAPGRSTMNIAGRPSLPPPQKNWGAQEHHAKLLGRIGR